MLVSLAGTIADPDNKDSVGAAIFAVLQEGHATHWLTVLTDTHPVTGAYRLELICSCGCKHLDPASWDNLSEAEQAPELWSLKPWIYLRGQLEGVSQNPLLDAEKEDMCYPLR